MHRRFFIFNIYFIFTMSKKVLIERLLRLRLFCCYTTIIDYSKPWKIMCYNYAKVLNFRYLYRNSPLHRRKEKNRQYKHPNVLQFGLYCNISIPKGKHKRTVFGFLIPFSKTFKLANTNTLR